MTVICRWWRGDLYLMTWPKLKMQFPIVLLIVIDEALVISYIH